jgi:hypothetical protein
MKKKQKSKKAKKRSSRKVGPNATWRKKKLLEHNRKKRKREWRQNPTEKAKSKERKAQERKTATPSFPAHLLRLLFLHPIHHLLSQDFDLSGF